MNQFELFQNTPTFIYSINGGVPYKLLPFNLLEHGNYAQRNVALLLHMTVGTIMQGNCSTMWEL